MSNRLAWVAVVVVVLVVGLLVFRSLRSSPSTGELAPGVAGSTEGTASAPAQATAISKYDTLRTADGRPASGVARAQTALKDKGFYNGLIDGNYGPELAEAIKRFQKANGMREDGYLNARLYTALGLHSQKRH